MTIEKVAGTNGSVTRSRIGAVTACHYSHSDRIVLIADKGDFAGAEEALRELRAEIDI